MKATLCVTARGHGFWGKPLGVELAIARTTRLTADGVHGHTATSHVVLLSDNAISAGSRWFPTDADRAAFLAASFTQLELAPVDPHEERDRPDPLAELVGGELVAVTFVRDHVQLQFDGGTVNLYVLPRIHRADAFLTRTTDGYNDALLCLINQPLIAVDEVLDLGLVFDFPGARLAVPLDGSDLQGTEIAEFHGAAGWTVWTPDDPSVDWLPG